MDEKIIGSAPEGAEAPSLFSQTSGEKETAGGDLTKASSEKPEKRENSEKSDEAADIARVKSIPDKRGDARREKREKRARKKKLRREKYPSRLSIATGAVIFIFAVIGVGFTAYHIISALAPSDGEESEFAAYNEYLAPVAAVDLDGFDDIASADRQQLITVALWYILSKDTTPDAYSYSEGYMLIPSSDVEQAYMSLFGPETAGSIEHMTVTGYNCTFEFDSTAMMYKIPVTTVTPVYTPRVVSAQRSGSSLLLTVEYLASESWARDSQGNFVAPEPDKTTLITLSEMSGAYYISSVKVISSTVPEAVTTASAQGEQDAQPDNEEEEASEQTTASAVAERTTLGGNV